MRILDVALAARSYPIYIDSGLLAQGKLWQPHLGTGGTCIVTNETVGPRYLPALRTALPAPPLAVVELPDGERHKTLANVERIFDALMTAGAGRDVTLLALGGGVVGDMAGFAAACYQRGVRFLQFPTTLLAQVDSSVGGKTGVNHPLGKNMIGAFHQPRAVVIDTAVLDTLPELDDPVPSTMRDSRGLIPYRRALELIHRPTVDAEWRAAQESLRFQEAFVLQAALLRQREWLRAIATTAPPCSPT